MMLNVPRLVGLALLLGLAVGCADSEMHGNAGAAGTGGRRPSRSGPRWAGWRRRNRLRWR